MLHFQLTLFNDESAALKTKNAHTQNLMDVSLRMCIFFFLLLTGFEKYFPNGKNGKKASEPKEVMGEKKGTFSKEYV